MKVEATCKCGSTATINPSSLRVNVRRNGVYRCYTCAVSSDAHASAISKSLYRGGNKRDRRVEAICGCGRVLTISEFSRDKNSVDGQYVCGTCKSKAAKAVLHKVERCDAKGKKYPVVCQCGAIGGLTYNKWRASVRRGSWTCRSCVNKKAALNSSYGNRGQRKATIPIAVKPVPVKCSKCGTEYTIQHSYAIRLKDKPIVCLSCAFDDRISSLETGVMRVLDEMGVKYIHHWRHWYEFDILVGDRLLIECQGTYWHNRSKQKSVDKRKYEYVKEMLPEYRIAYVWENEVKDLDALRKRLSSLVGAGERQAVDLSDVEIRECTRDDVKSFLDAYHYLGLKRWGQAWGAYAHGDLIAACLFTSPIRQNQNYGGNFVVLDRFCVHPDVECENLASWFMSRCLKLVGRRVVTFADTTEGHTGAIYKACNFKFSHDVAPDYWYVEASGRRLHKKTVWNQSKRAGVPEADYARAAGLEKVWGDKKLCFVYG